MAQRPLDFMEIVDDIRPILHGAKPEQIGAALGCIAATYFAGCHPDFRKMAIDQWMNLLLDLIPVEVEQGIAKGTFPATWRDASCRKH